MYNRNSSGCVTTGFLGQACNNVERTYHQFETDFETGKLSGYYLVENRQNISVFGAFSPLTALYTASKGSFFP